MLSINQIKRLCICVVLLGYRTWPASELRVVLLLIARGLRAISKRGSSDKRVGCVLIARAHHD